MKIDTGGFGFGTTSSSGGTAKTSSSQNPHGITYDTITIARTADVTSPGKEVLASTRTLQPDYTHGGEGSRLQQASELTPAFSKSSAPSASLASQDPTVVPEDTTAPFWTLPQPTPVSAIDSTARLTGMMGLNSEAAPMIPASRTPPRSPTPLSGTLGSTFLPTTLITRTIFITSPQAPSASIESHLSISSGPLPPSSPAGTASAIGGPEEPTGVSQPFPPSSSSSSHTRSKVPLIVGLIAGLVVLIALITVGLVSFLRARKKAHKAAAAAAVEEIELDSETETEETAVETARSAFYPTGSPLSSSPSGSTASFCSSDLSDTFEICQATVVRFQRFGPGQARTVELVAGPSGSMVVSSSSGSFGIASTSATSGTEPAELEVEGF